MRRAGWLRGRRGRARAHHIPGSRMRATPPLPPPRQRSNAPMGVQPAMVWHGAGCQRQALPLGPVHTARAPRDEPFVISLRGSSSSGHASPPPFSPLLDGTLGIQVEMALLWSWLRLPCLLQPFQRARRVSTLCLGAREANVVGAGGTGCPRSGTTRSSTAR